MSPMSPASIARAVARWNALVEKRAAHRALIAHNARARRVVNPAISQTTGVVMKAIHALYPWDIKNYPGKWKLAQSALGLGSLDTARHVAAGRQRLSGAARLRLLAFLRAKVAAINAIIAELEHDARAWAARPRRTGAAAHRARRVQKEGAPSSGAPKEKPSDDQ